MVWAGSKNGTLAIAAVALAVAMTADGRQESAKVGPEPIRADGIGRLVTGIEAKTIDGKTCALESGAQATVIAFTDVSCPLTKRYAPTLAALEDNYKSSGVRFVFINPSSADERGAIENCIKDNGFDGDYIWDKKGTIAATLGAKTTTEVFLLDAKGTLVYRGAVDDQYGLGYQNAAPKSTYLKDAIDSVLGGKRPEVEATTAPGCALAFEPKPMDRKVTYYDQVSRVLQRNCVNCHRDGGVAPFALDSYEGAESHKGMVDYVVKAGTMPPWFAAPSPEGHSPWANDRSLSAQDKKDLADWIAGGCPKGDEKLAPTPLSFETGWLIGKPDVVMELPREVPVQATGQMAYIHMQVPTNYDEDKWVEAVEVHPTDRAVVHHVLIFVVEDGKINGRRLFETDETTGFLIGYVPGTDHVEYPQGEAKRLPKGATLLVQIHYTPNGKATADRTKFAIRFAKKPPVREMQVYGISGKDLAIPPGDPAWVNTKTVTVPRDLMLTALMPHMHFRGKAFKYEAEYPDGRKELLLDVPRYDFNWQITYRYAVPKLMPQGTKITVTATYDNSTGNPANPDPTRTVPWGLQTTDEMMLGYAEYFVPGAAPGEAVRLGG